jgi:outer membrane protein
MNFARKHLVTAAIGILLVSGFSLPAAAQEVKIGVVNVPVLLDRAPQTKAAMDALQEEFAPRQREFVAKQKELEDLTAKIQKDVAVMGETERRNAEKNLRDLQRDVARLQQEFREDLELRQNEVLGELQRALLKELQDYAQAQGQYHGRGIARRRGQLPGPEFTLIRSASRLADAGHPRRTRKPIRL